MTLAASPVSSWNERRRQRYAEGFGIKDDERLARSGDRLSRPPSRMNSLAHHRTTQVVSSRSRLFPRPAGIDAGGFCSCRGGAVLPRIFFSSCAGLTLRMYCGSIPFEDPLLRRGWIAGSSPE